MRAPSDLCSHAGPRGHPPWRARLGRLACVLGFHARTTIDLMPLRHGWRWFFGCRDGCQWRSEKLHLEALP
jgi:hypothetical protein